jgi:hypothetical protein
MWSKPDRFCRFLHVIHGFFGHQTGTFPFSIAFANRVMKGTGNGGRQEIDGGQETEGDRKRRETGNGGRQETEGRKTPPYILIAVNLDFGQPNILGRSTH